MVAGGCPVSETNFVREAILNRVGDDLDAIAGVHLRRLPPFTTLVVRTVNSVYRVVITLWPEVYIQGGEFFPDPTPAYLDGASTGGMFRVGWIGVGLVVHIRTAGRRIITSRVCAITTEPQRRI